MYFEKNIWNLIYSFDNTYKIIFDSCLIQLLRNNCINEFKNKVILRKDNLFWASLGNDKYIKGTAYEFIDYFLQYY